MILLGKIKEGAKGILKEHPASVVTFFLSFLFLGILSYDYKFKYPVPLDNTLTFLEYFFLALTPALLLCESNFRYKKSIGKIESLKQFNKSFVYLIVMVIAVLMSAAFALFRVRFFNVSEGFFGSSLNDAEEFFLRFFFVYLVICLCSAVFFLYKKSRLSFEQYCVKGFLGLLKGYLAYGVITLGALCIIWVFQTLIYDIDIIEFVIAIITGLVAYTTALLALSRPGDKISKFGNIMMGYVFPSILAIAFVIVYAYILKILFTWTFPSNKAFAIVTALFTSGICFWTMAQGCMEGVDNGYHKLLKIFPLLFIPFIAIQIMCLYMRVDQYGLTTTRYLGVLLIIFEIMYEIYYIVRLKAGKGLGGVLFPVMIAFALVFFLVPGVNAYASVTRSQKKVVESALTQLQNSTGISDQDLAKARSAFREITNDGGLEGKLYVNKLDEKYSKEFIDEKFRQGSSSYTEDRKYMYASTSFDTMDVSGYCNLAIVNISLSDDIDIHNIELTSGRETESYGVADLSALIKEMEIANKSGVNSYDMDSLIEKPFEPDEENTLYIEYISVEEDSFGNVVELHMNGYYLYN
jgi:hypothetical protein